MNRNSNMGQQVHWESKPLPTPKFKPKVIPDSKLDFRINQNLDVCRICPEICGCIILSASVISPSMVKTGSWLWEMLKNVQKSPIPQWWIKWKSDHMPIRITTKSWSLLECHPLPMSAKFGRRPFPRSSVILFKGSNNTMHQSSLKKLYSLIAFLSPQTYYTILSKVWQTKQH